MTPASSSPDGASATHANASASVATWPSIPALARDAGERFADSEAVVDGNRRLSFARLWAGAVIAARAFVAIGIEHGDRVAIWAPNSYEWVVALLGLQSAGASVVPLNTRFRGSEAAYILNRSRSRALVTVEGFLGVDYRGLLASQELPHLERLIVLRAGDDAPAGGGAPGSCPSLGWDAFLALADGVAPDTVSARIDALGPDDISDLMFTSGTTGSPKGVVTTHGQSVRTFAQWRQIVGLAAGDRYLLVNPMFHTFGYKAGILTCLMAGATMIPVPVFDVAAVLERIAAERVTVLPGPPTLYQSLLQHPDLAQTDISSLRLAVTGAAVIPVDLVRQMRDGLGFRSVLTAYGLTEATGFVTSTTHDDDIETIASTSGRAIDGVEVRTVAPDGTDVPTGSPGEVVCRGFNVMQGYFEDPEQTAATIDAGGWLHTGDVGVLDEGGNLRITDRIKDMYIVGGFNAYPAEVESLLLGHPGIAQAAVVGVPDDRLGEVGAAFVVAAAGHSLEPDEVVAWAREHMANYKAPRYVRVVDALPLNASGKVLKFALQEQLRP
jgi:acyl-CoA synthetase (AMP-forming)/AMP-acid ligase II